MNELDYLIPTQEVNKYLNLLQRRKELLDKEPELRIVQNKIDQTLQEVGNNPIERCVIIQHIMLQSLNNLHSEHNEMVELMKQLEDKLNTLIITVKKEVEDVQSLN